MFKYIYITFVFCSISSNPGTELVHLGTKYGGWVIPANLITENSIVYCAGAGEDISFDVELVNRYNCNVFIIDPAPRAIIHWAGLIKATILKQDFSTIPKEINYSLNLKNIPNLIFIPVGLWNEDQLCKFYVSKNSDHVSHSINNLQGTNNYLTVPSLKLSSLMKKFKHHKIDLLKLDIEGSERLVLEKALEENVDIKCICVEFDELRMRGKKELIELFKKSLNHYGYKLVHEQDRINSTYIKGVK